jgi:hypothetical protein
LGGAVYVVAVKDLSALISTLSEDKQQRFVAAISHLLTVVARNYTYKLGTQDPDINIAKLRVLNEMQHQLSSCLSKTFGEYPIIAAIEGIRQQAEQGGLLSQTDWAIEQTISRFRKRTD